MPWPCFAWRSRDCGTAPAQMESRIRAKAEAIKCASKKMRLHSAVNLALHCRSSSRLRVDAVALVHPFYARLPQKINTSEYIARLWNLHSQHADRLTTKPVWSIGPVITGTRRYERQNGLCYTAASARVSSSRTAIARSYKAFASSWELPTAVRPVLPSSPRALIM